VEGIQAMNRILILSVMAFFAALMPIVPALACFPENTQTGEVLFASSDGGRSFSNEPLPMLYCESGEKGFVIVNGKCYDQDAILDFETEEECQADEVCKAYREQQKQQEEPEPRPPCQPSGDLDVCIPWDDDKIVEEPEPALCTGLCDDPNHGEIKGDEELDLAEDEEEHQKEEEQGQEESEETTAETNE
jgi:hypothetical protein